jgi:aldehyde dehydrogenase (NAD+)
MSQNIPAIVAGVKSYFDSQITKTYEWRKSQLEGVLKLLQENEKELVAALAKDLGKQNKKKIK